MNTRSKYSLIPSVFGEGTFPSLFRHLTLFDDDTWMPALTADKSNLSLSEDEGHVYVEANLPGVPEGNIDVSLDKGVLWIKGEVQENEEDEKRKYYYRANRAFSYRLAVPGNIDEKKEPTATFENGVVKIAFNKLVEESPKKIQIKTK